MFGALPASGFYVRHAAGVELRNAHVTVTNGDRRPVLATDDVTKLVADPPP